VKAAAQLIQAPTVDLTLKDKNGLTALESAKNIASSSSFHSPLLSELIQLLEKAEADRIASIPEEMKSESIN